MIVGSTFISDLVLSSALYFGLVSVVRFGLIISFHLVNKQNTAFCDSDYISSIHHIRSSWERILHCSRNRSQGVYPQRSPLRRWCQGLDPLFLWFVFPLFRSFPVTELSIHDLDLSFDFYFEWISVRLDLRLIDFEIPFSIVVGIRCDESDYRVREMWAISLGDWSCFVYG